MNTKYNDFGQFDNIENDDERFFTDPAYDDKPFLPVTDLDALRQAAPILHRFDARKYEIYEWMEDERGLGLTSFTELKVYAYLYSFHSLVGTSTMINQKALGKRLHLSRVSINRAIKRLAEMGLIEKVDVCAPGPRGGVLQTASRYRVLQEPINRAILNTLMGPINGEDVFGIDVNKAIAEASNTASNDNPELKPAENGVEKTQVAPVLTADTLIENQQVAPVLNTDTPVFESGQSGQQTDPLYTRDTPGDTCGNVGPVNSDTPDDTCGNATNAQDSSLIDSPYRTEVEEEVEVGKIYRSGRVTTRIQPVDVTGVVDGVGTQIPTGEVGMSSGVTVEASRSMPSPAAAAKGGAGDAHGMQQAADAALPDVSALGLSSADLKAVDAIVATSRKPSAKQAESVARTKIAFHERLMDGWTPMQLIRAFKVYVRDTYKDVRPGTPEERERSRYEKFPANWLSSDSEVAMWDQAAGGNGTPAGSPTRAARAGYVSQKEAMSAPACGNGTDKHGNPTVDGHPVRVKKIAGIWEYYDSYNSWAYLDDLGNLTEEQAIVRAAEKLRFELAKPDPVQAGEIAQGRSRLHARTRELPSLAEKFARVDSIGKVV